MTKKQYLKRDTQILSYDSIEWLPIPERPISHKDHLSNRRPFWRKQARVFNLVAQGFSLEAEIKHLVAREADCTRDTISHAIQKLDEGGLLYKHTRSITLGSDIVSGTKGRGSILFSLVRLNRHGRGLCRQLASLDNRWRPHETQWERMRRIHEQGKREPDHTLGTLIFAYKARQRGWSAGVMPDFQVGRFVPDAVVEKDGKKFYVEVEFHYGKQAKWRNMYDALGYIAFCGRSWQHEETLLKECQEVGRPVYSTNLTDLIIGKETLWE